MTGQTQILRRCSPYRNLGFFPELPQDFQRACCLSYPQVNTMTTRELSRTVIAALAAFADKPTAGGTNPQPNPARAPAAAAPPQPPVISGLSPDTGSTGGSTALKISGSGFQSGPA